MATEVKLPRLGQGMESGTIVRWLKAEGDAVKKREPLYELDTDKVTQEVESDLDGVLLKIVVAEGEVEVGSTIAVIGNGDGAADVCTVDPCRVCGRRRARRRTGGGCRRAAGGSEPRALPPGGNGGAAVGLMPEGGRIKASPLARRIARERGVDLTALAGTGPDGRIVAEDVEQRPVRVCRRLPRSRSRPRPERSRSSR